MQKPRTAPATFDTAPDVVAEAFNVSGATIRRMCAAGKLPAIKVGSQWRIDSAAAEAALRGTPSR